MTREQELKEKLFACMCRRAILPTIQDNGLAKKYMAELYEINKNPIWTLGYKEE